MILRNALPLVLLGLLAAGSAARGQTGGHDPTFSKVPFDRWIADGDQKHFRWTVRMGGTELSSHQRLLTKIEVQVDGNELVDRRGHGQLVMMIQIQDKAEQVYQAHGVIDLQDIKDDAGKSNVVYIQSAFVVPGDYHASMLIFDTKTGEHSAIQKPLHVGGLRNDPLAGAWKDLPAVEMLPAMEVPDDWFRPDLTARLHLSVTPPRPVRVEVLMNASSSAPVHGSSETTVSTRILANLIPALKVLSQIDVVGGMLHVALLDIPKRRVIFEQDAAHPPGHLLDWPRMREALTEADPNKIDVRALEHREKNAQFFVEQVRQRLTGPAEPPADDPARVLIVLTGPVTFGSGEDTHPIELSGKPNGKVYYVRYHLPLPPAQPVNPLIEGPYFGRGRNRAVQQPQFPPEPLDSMESLLKPLEPRLFDIYSPEQFRKAVSSILEDIGRL